MVIFGDGHADGVIRPYRSADEPEVGGLVDDELVAGERSPTMKTSGRLSADPTMVSAYRETPIT